MQKRVMISCSGGPDSMFLLELNKDKDPLVFHVNYNRRADSNLDQTIVERYCQENGLELVVKVLKKADFKGGNFHAWARQRRYDLALEVANKVGLDTLLVAHQRDDFLETALMQKGRGNFLIGIPPKTLWRSKLLITRPLLFLHWKDEIIDTLDKRGIKYALDSSNLDPIYTRARVRLRLEAWGRFRKTIFLYWLRFFNIFKQRSLERGKRIYRAWELSGFSINYFNSLKMKQREQQVYLFIAFRLENIVKFSSRKVRAILDYLKADNSGKIFKVSDLLAFKKEGGKLVILRVSSYKDRC